MSSASDSNSAYAFSYHGDGHMASVDNAGTPSLGAPGNVVLTSAYDPLGDRTSLSATINGTADFLNSYWYDADQRLTMVQQQDVNGGNVVSPKEIEYGYNAIGQFTSVVDYNFIGVGPVYHDPFYVSSPNYGITARFNTTVYGVYVPPTMQ